MVDSGGANRHWNSRRFKMCTTHHSVGSVNVCCELDCFLLSFLFPLLLRMLLEIPIFLLILIYQLLIQNHCVDYQRSYNKWWNVLIERMNCNSCTNKFTLLWVEAQLCLPYVCLYRVPQKYRLKVYGSEGHKNGANQILILCMFFSTSGHLV